MWDTCLFFAAPAGVLQTAGGDPRTERGTQPERGSKAHKHQRMHRLNVLDWSTNRLVLWSLQEKITSLEMQIRNARNMRTSCWPTRFYITESSAYRIDHQSTIHPMSLAPTIEKVVIDPICFNDHCSPANCLASICSNTLRNSLILNLDWTTSCIYVMIN